MGVEGCLVVVDPVGNIVGEGLDVDPVVGRVLLSSAGDNALLQIILSIQPQHLLNLISLLWFDLRILIIQIFHKVQCNEFIFDCFNLDKLILINEWSNIKTYFF